MTASKLFQNFVYTDKLGNVNKILFAVIILIVNFSWQGIMLACSAFCFSLHEIKHFYCLNPKIQASSHLLLLYSPVCVGSGQKPQRLVFSQRGSYFSVFKDPGVWEMLEQFGNTASTSVSIAQKNR